MTTRLTIAQAINELRQQISDAVIGSDDKRIKFKARSIELELMITHGWERQAGVEVGVWSIIKGTGSAKHTNQDAHRVKLTLEPLEITHGIKIEPLFAAPRNNRSVSSIDSMSMETLESTFSDYEERFLQIYFELNRLQSDLLSWKNEKGDVTLSFYNDKLDQLYEGLERVRGFLKGLPSSLIPNNETEQDEAASLSANRSEDVDSAGEATE